MALDRRDKRTTVIDLLINGDVVSGSAARGAVGLVLFCPHKQIIPRYKFGRSTTYIATALGLYALD
jgi:hypothetical protein